MTILIRVSHLSKTNPTYLKSIHNLTRTCQPLAFSMWIPWTLFNSIFRDFFVCRLTASSLPPRFYPGWTTSTVVDEWSTGCQGGGISLVGWKTNPMYRLTVSRRPVMVPWRLRVNLSLPDRRQYDPQSAVPRRYPRIGINMNATPDLSQLNPDFTPDLSQLYPKV